MKAFVRGLKQFYRDEQGAQGVEYALLAGLIAIAFIAGASVLGDNLNAFFDALGACVQDPAGSCTGPWG
jgi:Flp pilus assembly pilin Flp